MVTIGNGTTAEGDGGPRQARQQPAVRQPGPVRAGPRQRGRASRSTCATCEAMRDAAFRREGGGAGGAEIGDDHRHGTENRITVVTGTDNDYFVTQDWPLSRGPQLPGGRAARRPRRLHHRRDGARQAVRRAPIRSARSIRVGKVSCEVIGVLEPKGQSSFGTDQDDIVLMPIRTFQRRIAGNTDIVAGAGFGARRRGDRQGAGRHRAAAARAAQHRRGQGGRFLRPRHEADRAGDRRRRPRC